MIRKIYLDSVIRFNIQWQSQLARNKKNRRFIVIIVRRGEITGGLEVFQIITTCSIKKSS